MTTSVFGWLDQDDSERLRMMEIINLFREQGTQDELGASPIRDAFSNSFFPGTTTVQTRVRYFLFVPWIHLNSERARSKGTFDPREERKLHTTLVDSLIEGQKGSTRGVIGSAARESLKRLPSDIYWTGLNAWGIRLSGESIEQYDEMRLASQGDDRGGQIGENGELIVPESRYWHPGIPDPPEDLFERTTFQVTREEAEFLQERILDSCPSSLLAGCLAAQIGNVRAAKFPWELERLDLLDQQLQADIEHARLFALMAEGAAILYNLMLAQRAACHGLTHHEKSGYGEDETVRSRVQEYTDSLAKWANEVDSEQAALQHWDREKFWNRVRKFRPSRRPPAELFFDLWIEIAIKDPPGLAANDDARQLISNRERRLKGSLARLHHLRPLERWNGWSGLGRMTYRWYTARTHLVDILDGLDRETADSDA